MSGSNESAFFHAQYANALQAWKDKKPLEADNICRMLVAEFPCPRFLQVHAWQLRSLCTTQYFEARSHLRKCFPILAKFLREDPIVQKLWTHTEQMIAELDRIWDNKWRKLGEKAPTESELAKEEEAEDEKYEREAADADKEKETETKVSDAAKAMSGMDLDPNTVPLSSEGEVVEEGDEMEVDDGGTADAALDKPKYPGFITGAQFSRSEFAKIPPLKQNPYTAAEVEAIQDWKRDETEEQRESMEIAEKYAEAERRARGKSDTRMEGVVGEEGYVQEGSRTEPTGPPSPPGQKGDAPPSPPEDEVL